MTRVLASHVFYDGLDDTPRLAHPEGVAVHRDGSVWCGSENGQVFRIAPDGKSCEVVAELGGFLLGLAFDDAGFLYVCHQSERTIFRVDTESGEAERLTEPGGGPSLPNHLVVDRKRGRLLVSDSRRIDEPGPSVWEVDLATGEARPWLAEPLDFANGLAFTGDQAELLIAVSWERSVRRVEVLRDGSAGSVSHACYELPGMPDGLAVIDGHDFIVSLYEPSELWLVEEGQVPRRLARDETAHVMCHPTNIAFRGSDLFTANLGRWHITHLETDLAGPLSSFPSDLVRMSGD